MHYTASIVLLYILCQLLQAMLDLDPAVADLLPSPVPILLAVANLQQPLHFANSTVSMSTPILALLAVDVVVILIRRRRWVRSAAETPLRHTILREPYHPLRRRQPDNNAF